MPASSKRVALVTGGRRGIGLGIARCLAREGCDLAICGTVPHGDTAVSELQQLGGQVLYVQADVGMPADRQRLLDQVRGRFGRLDVLVNNAGVAPKVRADILEATEESFEQLLRTNLQGPYFLTQAVARWMIQQRQADASAFLCIVNISSISATVASVNRGDYCISKAGVGMATQLWAARLAELDISVYEIRPGIIATDMTVGVKAKYDQLISQGLLLQSRWGEPEDVGRAVAMLARGDLAYSTGQVIYVDGGMQVRRL
jgi:NAD(P)-dependent dehydrogenase (short-subunit alcohol dehydrogenase family)